MSQSLEDELTEDLIVSYRTAGIEVGYCAKRFYQALRRSGGLANSKRLLRSKNSGASKGLTAMREADRLELTIEAIVLKEKYRELFTTEELEIARQRLRVNQKEVAELNRARAVYPDELDSGLKYPEGAYKKVEVNAYERSLAARRACIAHYGVKCTVCEMDFRSRYGELGDGFIHVDHLNQLALNNEEYAIDPVKDLRPVCPNCHAMLHRKDPILTVEQLRSILSGAA